MKIFIRRKILIASAVFSTLITVGCEKPDLKSKTTSSNEPIAINTEDSKLKNERQSITKETIKKCEENLSKAGDQYNYYFQKKQYDDALQMLDGCDNEELSLDKYITLANAAHVEKINTILNNNEKSPAEKLSAYDEFEKSHPKVALSLNINRVDLLEKSISYASNKSIKSKSKEGVFIGMTKSEVLQSNWGKPRKINRTITQSTVHEQWVYSGSNYLCFDNEYLTSIQN